MPRPQGLSAGPHRDPERYREGVTSHQPPASRLLFDGDCAFCTSAAEWARRRIRPRVPIVAWQGEIDTLPPLAVGMAQEAVVFMDGDTPVASGATASRGTGTASPADRRRANSPAPDAAAGWG